VTDAIVLRGMAFEGRHGATDEERELTQTIELDVELRLDLRAAGQSDDLGQTIDYAAVFEVCRAQVEEHSYRLLEALAEGLAAEILDRFTLARAVVVEARKPGVPIDGVIDHAGVRIERSRG
jgi:dihydroneopterin aldolase